jgi:hypothetical protein
MQFKKFFIFSIMGFAFANEPHSIIQLDNQLTASNADFDLTHPRTLIVKKRDHSSQLAPYFHDDLNKTIRSTGILTLWSLYKYDTVADWVFWPITLSTEFMAHYINGYYNRESDGSYNQHSLKNIIKSSLAWATAIGVGYSSNYYLKNQIDFIGTDVPHNMAFAFLMSFAWDFVFNYSFTK